MTEKWHVTNVGMIEELLRLDQDVFLTLNGLGTQAWDPFWLFITNKWASIPVYLLLLIFSYRLLGFKKTGLLLIAIALLITASDQLANFFKYGVQRPRPCYDPEIGHLVRLVKASCGGKFGFYSAHAANSFSIASFFALLLKPYFRHAGWLLLFWAALVAYSRVYIGVHYPLDIFAGMLFGLSLH